MFLWITFETIFAGGVHDYFSGMLSERNRGVSISEVTGTYLGGRMKNLMRFFSAILLNNGGNSICSGPAGLIVALIKDTSGVAGLLVNKQFLLVLIFLYYLIAIF